MTQAHDAHDTPTGTDADQAALDEMAQLLFEGAQTGAAIKDLKGVSDDLLESVYAYAHRFYTDGRLDEAETFFRFLYLYDFYNGDYALGLAAVLQMKKEYAKAIDMYALAYALLKNDERPMLHVGQCHLAMGKLGMAKGCFETVQLRSTDPALLSRARVYLQALANQGDAPPDTTEETDSA
ncbi:SycD/LcrH family type III secretion system chaperone [Stenotrophomonas rhizophila]|uniref:SycD/LcrH family type III secretion system chaperone n=1 Tax=Stenotrophomonas rhizophila TaxID=216778 RepID=UPI001C930ECC|nr:SycD/LcrH family type III secretion system chaperone [Stenotrophomonas rhizophila]